MRGAIRPMRGAFWVFLLSANRPIVACLVWVANESVVSGHVANSVFSCVGGHEAGAESPEARAGEGAEAPIMCPDPEVSCGMAKGDLASGCGRPKTVDCASFFSLTWVGVVGLCVALCAGLTKAGLILGMLGILAGLTKACITAKLGVRDGSNRASTVGMSGLHDSSGPARAEGTGDDGKLSFSGNCALTPNP